MPTITKNVKFKIHPDGTFSEVLSGFVPNLTGTITAELIFPPGITIKGSIIIIPKTGAEIKYNFSQIKRNKSGILICCLANTN